MVQTPGGRTSGAPVLQPVPSLNPPILVVWDAAVSEALAAGATDIKVTAHIPAPVAPQPVKLRNVIGVLRGSDPALKDTYLVLTAHYDHLGVRGTGDGDHIFNGANDDASGTSSVIEIAKALAALAQRPRRSIVFMTFFGEELGDLGSRYYCQHPVFPLAKTVADLNLEQLGRTDDIEGPRPLQFNLTGFDYSDIAAFLSKAGERTGIRVVKHEQNSDSFFARSDNAAFAEAGVPSTTLSVGYIFPDYHRPGDEWPKLDYDNMAKVDGAVALGVYGMADSAEAPQWNKGNPKTARYVQARENKAN
jgi:Zn-dependent M28 family amino/carboxypeptidase